MDAIGKVIELKEDTAVVQIKRATACGENCKMCGGCDSLEQTTEVQNTIGAGLGDIVKFELATNKVLFASFIVYIVPLIALIIGYICLGFLYGIAFFVILFSFLKVLDKKLGGKYTGKTVKIIDRFDK